MQSLSEDQISREDFVDNEIYDLVKRLIPFRLIQKGDRYEFE